MTTNDLLMASDSELMSVLVLLNMNVAFDRVDHDILLQRSEDAVGINSTVLLFFIYP